MNASPIHRVFKVEEAREPYVEAPAEIIIDKEVCKKCYNCVKSCTVPGSVFEIGEDGYPRPVRKDYCIMCLVCHMVCPARAIKHVGVRLVTMLVFDKDVVERVSRML